MQMRSSSVRSIMLSCLLVLTIVLSACGNRAPNASNGPRGFSAGQGQVLDPNREAIATQVVNGQVYVVMPKLIKTLGLDSSWDPSTQTLSFGERDAAYQVKSGSDVASNGERNITLSRPAILQGGSLLLPVQDAGNLLGDAFHLQWQGAQLVAVPAGGDQTANGQANGQDSQDANQPDFADDPEDPGKASPTAAPTMAADAVPVLKNVNTNALIATAKRYLGVKYLFGAKPYPISHRFDCSSFTQFIYGKYGVYLPRVARAQARRGITVSRTKLRRGDLVFFYIPGRFKSNAVVGHVGIYMGNGYMINADTLPKNGVQINYINTAYWKRTFIVAKRVVS